MTTQNNDYFYIHKNIEARKTNRGFGLFATDTIFKDEIVSISGGRLMPKKEWERLVKEKNYDDHAYQVEDNFVISPLDADNVGIDWYMNHCCHPNVGVKGQITFVALRDIQSGEELTYDYCMTESDPDYSFELSCDKDNCRKRLTGNDWKNKELQERYKGYFSKYIEDKIDGKTKSNNLPTLQEGHRL